MGGPVQCVMSCKFLLQESCVFMGTLSIQYTTKYLVHCFEYNNEPIRGPLWTLWLDLTRTFELMTRSCALLLSLPIVSLIISCLYPNGLLFIVLEWPGTTTEESHHQKYKWKQELGQFSTPQSAEQQMYSNLPHKKTPSEARVENFWQ